MMMIAFITENESNLVPLLEGLSSLNPCVFELLVKKEAVSVIILTSSSRLFR